MSDGKYSNRSEDFALQEHQLLRTEIIGLVEETRSTERNVLIAIAAVWTFLITHPPAIADRWTWFIPPLIVVVGLARLWAIHMAFRQLAKYLRDTESLFRQQDGIEGWETFLLKLGRRRFVLMLSTASVSVLILSVTLFVGVYKYRQKAALPSVPVSTEVQKNQSPTPSRR